MKNQLKNIANADASTDLMRGQEWTDEYENDVNCILLQSPDVNSTEHQQETSDQCVHTALSDTIIKIPKEGKPSG